MFLRVCWLFFLMLFVVIADVSRLMLCVDVVDVVVVIVVVVVVNCW